MTETTPANHDLERTVHLLEQGLASVNLGLALNVIEQWENQFPGTELFANLRELKQEILNGNLTNLANLLRQVSDNTAAVATDLNGADSPAPVEPDAVKKVQQISQLLADASRNLK